LLMSSATFLSIVAHHPFAPFDKLRVRRPRNVLLASILALLAGRVAGSSNRQLRESGGRMRPKRAKSRRRCPRKAALRAGAPGISAQMMQVLNRRGGWRTIR
jgi:hypothetical protein